MRLLTIIFVAVLLSSCTSTKVVDVKSPCVGNCGPKRFVNTWLDEYLI